METKKKNICIAGGGLVGGLCACFLAKRGFAVELYEMRPDFRGDSNSRGRSINLALSHRGLEALSRVGLKEKVTASGIAMHARMIHDLDGTTRAIPYGKPGQFIMSVDRMGLNELLLNAAMETYSVKTYFNHKVLACNPEKGEVTFFNSENEEEVTKSFDLIIGCDGAYSSIRRSMAHHCRFNFEQEYIEHGYLELGFPAAPGGRHAMATNYLHIWPRNEFMMIGLPNMDGSFTGTAFMPFGLFDQLTTRDKVLQFFKETFPDAVPLIGEQSIADTILGLQPLPMISIRCQPYHVTDKMLIIGDAAHAMVPFYGQGMNCGFEDCIILDELMDQHHEDFATVLPAFTDARVADAHAIVALAQYNYVEMRKSVNSIRFLIRKKLDNLLHRLLPNHWVPLYTMVTFSRTPYSQAIRDKQWQDRVLSRILLAGSSLGLLCAAWLCKRAGGFGAVQTGAVQLMHRLQVTSLWTK